MRTASISDRTKKCLRQKRGTTMIEVLVAVIVVLLITAMFSQVVTVSVRMFRSSVEMMNETEDFNREYYKTVNYGARTRSAEGLTLSVDREKTRDVTVSDASLALNGNSSIVYWAEPDGFDMYAVSISSYKTSLGGTPGGGPAPGTPDPAPTSGPTATSEPGPVPGTPGPASTSGPVATSEPGSVPGPGGSYGLTVDVEDERKPVWEYNDWDRIIEEVRQQQEASKTPENPAGQPNWPHEIDAGHVYMFKNEDTGKYEAYVCVWGGHFFDIYADWTDEIFVKEKYPDNFIKITEDTRVFTSRNIQQYIENNGNKKTFDPDNLPKKGELYWDGRDYYLARGDIGPYETDFEHSGVWLRIEQPAEPPSGE